MALINCRKCGKEFSEWAKNCPQCGVTSDPSLDPDDNEELYRQHLAYLISQTKSRGNGRYYNQFVNKCRDEAAIAYPKGAAVAQKKDMKAGGFLGAIAAIFSIFG